MDSEPHILFFFSRPRPADFGLIILPPHPDTSCSDPCQIQIIMFRSKPDPDPGRSDTCADPPDPDLSCSDPDPLITQGPAH